MFRSMIAVCALVAVGAVSALAQAPNASSAQDDPFPPVNKRFFTATTPTVATVDAFLKATWGYDPNRIWKVEAIQKTIDPGVSKVTVFLAQKGPNQKVESFSFFAMPDGKHVLSGDQVSRFGEHPFAELRAEMQVKADGAYRGSASKDLMLVEFADLQCPHCKEAQAMMDNLVQDFPKARVVFQNYPLVEIHPFAYKSAAMGICVAQKSSNAFTTYVKAVFDKQESLTPEMGDKTLADAVTAAGADPAAVKTCSESAGTKAKLDAQVKLAEDSGVDQTPMLSVNGRLLPLGGMPYEVLKQIVAYQMEIDGIK